MTLPSTNTKVPGRSLPPTPSHVDMVLVGGCHGLAAIPRGELPDYYRGHAYVGLAALALALGAALVAAFW